VNSENSQALTENELAALNALADIGEMTRPVAHEFNNFLNTLLLHMGVIEPKLSEDLRSALGEIRKQARNVSAIIKELQLYRRQTPLPPGPVDLNVAVRAAVAGSVAPTTETPGNRAEPDTMSVQLDLDATAALVSALETDLTRLCSFLLRSAAANSGAIVLRTKSLKDKVTLWVEYGGPSVSRESLASFFDLGNPDSDGAHRLKLAACQSLVRRLQGRIGAEQRDDGTIAIRVELPRHGGDSFPRTSVDLRGNVSLNAPA